MKSIDPDTFFNVEIKFAERNIVFKFEVGMEFFRFENKKVLQKKNSQGQQNDPTNYIVNDTGQAVTLP